MRSVIPAQLVSALIGAYLGAHLPWNSVSSILQGGQLVGIVAAAIWISIGVWRHAMWAPKATVILASLSGVTNLSTFAGMFRVAGSNPGPAVVLSFALVVLLGLCQLWALFRGLQRLEYRPATV